jgi:chromate transporter
MVFTPGPLATFGASGTLLTIFVYFAKAGLFVFGSGLAVVPFLYGGVVQGHHWLTDKQFVDAVAVAMITPGPVVITVAFIGYLVAGIAGATAAALGIFLPVYLVVVLLAPSYKRWAKNPQLNAFVRGVTAAATGAIAGAVLVLARRSVYDLPTMLICAVSLAVLFRWKVPEPVLISLRSNSRAGPPAYLKAERNYLRWREHCEKCVVLVSAWSCLWHSAYKCVLRKTRHLRALHRSC